MFVLCRDEKEPRSTSDLLQFVLNLKPALEEHNVRNVAKAPWVHGAEAPDKPLVAALEEHNVRSVAKVPWVHGAEAPDEPLVAAR